jgi:hypothetical protein
MQGLDRRAGRRGTGLIPGGHMVITEGKEKWMKTCQLADRGGLTKKMSFLRRAWRHRPVISAFRRLRLEDHLNSGMQGQPGQHSKTASQKPKLNKTKTGLERQSTCLASEEKRRKSNINRTIKHHSFFV